MGCHEDFRNRSCFGPIEVSRNFRESAFPRAHEFCLRTAACNAKHALPNLPPSHFIAGINNFAGELEPGNVLRITGRRGIPPHALEDVRPIQSCRANPNAHTVGCWIRSVRHFADFEAFNSAERSYCDGTHLLRLWQELAGPFDDILDVESQILQRHFAGCRCAETIETNDVTGWSNVAIPTLPHAGFNCQTSRD